MISRLKSAQGGAPIDWWTDVQRRRPTAARSCHTPHKHTERSNHNADAARPPTRRRWRRRRRSPAAAARGHRRRSRRLLDRRSLREPPLRDRHGLLPDERLLGRALRLLRRPGLLEVPLRPRPPRAAQRLGSQRREGVGARADCAGRVPERAGLLCAAADVERDQGCERMHPRPRAGLAVRFWLGASRSEHDRADQGMRARLAHTPSLVRAAAAALSPPLSQGCNTCATTPTARTSPPSRPTSPSPTFASPPLPPSSSA